MPETSSKPTTTELKKRYPNMGKRWQPEEDQKLKSRYETFRALPSASFDVFMEDLVQEFGRARGGLTARLASFFDDVPGFDYELAQNRLEQKEVGVQEIKNKLGAAGQLSVGAAYTAYVEAKSETYKQFIARMAETLGVAGKDITAFLRATRSTVVAYTQADITPQRAYVKVEEEVVVDFSGNAESEKALYVMEQTQDNLFLTGEAGTGKSTLLQYFRQHTKKNVVVLAPTGVAALNVRGQTIHSFCGFGPDITLAKVKRVSTWSPKKKLLQKLSMIVIDEISMVRADLLDCVDKFLRLNGPVSNAPFGGVQVVVIGDLYQLPPVEKGFAPSAFADKTKEQSAPLFGSADTASVEAGAYRSPYFFDSKVFRESNFQYIQLRMVYRQQDTVFIDLLNAVRNNSLDSEHLQVLNQRALAEGEDKFSFEEFAVYLTPTNYRAKQVNDYFLQRLPGTTRLFRGVATGSFEARELPTDSQLEVRVGAQVMMLNNDSKKRWVNGTMGKVVRIGSGTARGQAPAAAVQRPTTLDPEYVLEDTIPLPGDMRGTRTVVEQGSSTELVEIELETGEVVTVEPYTWEMYKFVLDGKTHSIQSESTGAFTQYPFKLAWAVTIHKAQGKTFSTVYIDLASGTFAHGQLYVALSRCRTLEGVHLRRPVVPEDIILDDRVVRFMHSLQ